MVGAGRKGQQQQQAGPGPADPKQDVKKSSYYVWFLGAKESKGLRGEEFIQPVVRYLTSKASLQYSAATLLSTADVLEHLLACRTVRRLSVFINNKLCSHARRRCTTCYTTALCRRRSSPPSR